MFRGTVLPVKERQPVSSGVVSRFGIQAHAPILDPAELYAGKLVAALDRQHPRDLFDVWMLYQHEGITPALLDCLVVYLAGHNRPTHEVLGGRDKMLDQVYEEQVCWNDRSRTTASRDLVGIQVTTTSRYSDTADISASALSAGSVQG